MHPDLTYPNDRTGYLIPQQVYQPPTGYTPLDSVRFSCGGVAGVRVVDAEPGVIRNLDNRTFRPLINPVGNRIALRIFVGINFCAFPTQLTDRQYLSSLDSGLATMGGPVITLPSNTTLLRRMALRWKSLLARLRHAYGNSMRYGVLYPPVFQDLMALTICTRKWDTNHALSPIGVYPRGPSKTFTFSSSAMLERVAGSLY